MKKFVLAMSLTMAMTAGATAMAATTVNKDNQSVAFDGTNYTTVLIENAAKDIVYVNQYDTAVTAAATFLMNSAADGTYTLSYGGVDAVQTVNFTIQSVVPEETTAMAPIGLSKEEGKDTYSKGFTLTTEDMESFKSIVLSYIEDGVTKSARLPISTLTNGSTTVTGESAVSLAVKVTNIPEAAKDSFTVSFSNIEAN